MIGVLTAALNAVALRLVRVDEVPGCMRARIRWWSAHNPAFLLVSAIVAAAGLTTLMAAALRPAMASAGPRTVAVGSRAPDRGRR